MAAKSSIPLRQLGPAVGKAVKAALDRHKAQADEQFIINPGIIAGPRLAVATDIKTAQKIAEEITKEVQKAPVGTKAEAAALPRLTAAVLITRGGIICGFFPYPVPEILVDR
jgi:hypothetical protein